MTKELKNSLIVLKRISNQLQNADAALKYIAGQMYIEYNKTPVEEETIFTTKSAMSCIIHYLFIWYACFLEEYERLTSLDQQLKPQVILARKDSKTYLDNLVDLFGNIRDTRNKILAHPYRSNSGLKASLLSDEKFNELNDAIMLHSNIEPYTQIANCIGLVISTLEKQFGEIKEEDVISS